MMDNGVVRFGPVMRTQEAYGEGWFYENAQALTIETVDTTIGMYGPVGGPTKNMTYDAGSTGATSAFADGGGGTVLVTSSGHGLSNGEIVTIMGSTSYNGVFEVSAVTTNTFKIADTWVANDGIATWIEPTSLAVEIPGLYHLDAHVSTSVSDACTLLWMPYKNTTPVVKGTVESRFLNSNTRSNAFAVFVEFEAGDRIWMSLESDSLINVTSKHGGMRVHKLCEQCIGN